MLDNLFICTLFIVKWSTSPAPSSTTPPFKKRKKLKKKLKKNKIKKPSHITCKLTTRSIGRFSPKTM